MSLKQEYFELLNLLNKSNKQKNTQTEAYFFISDDKTKFYMAIDENQKILICERTTDDEWWKITQVTKCLLFEEELAKFLNNSSFSGKITKQIKSFIFE